MGPGRHVEGDRGEKERAGEGRTGRQGGRGRRGIRHTVLEVEGVSRSRPPQLMPGASRMSPPASTLPKFLQRKNLSEVKGLC